MQRRNDRNPDVPTANRQVAPADSAGEFERVLAEIDARKIVLHLYVSGLTPRSTRAIADLRRLCREHLSQRCEVEVIDIYQQPARAVEAQILAVPTLVKLAPAPLRRLIGSLGQSELVLEQLGIGA